MNATQEGPAPGPVDWRTQTRAILGYLLVFQFVHWILFTPLLAGVLWWFLDRWGRCSVGNFEIAAFLLSPGGLVAILVLGGLTLATGYLELAGLAWLRVDRHATWWSPFRYLARHFPALVQLGFRQAVVFFLLALPFVALVGLAYFLFWSGHDLNGLIHLRPPTFWWGALLAGGAVLGYLLLAGRFFLRWIFSVPTLLFEPGTSPRSALALSQARTSDQMPSLTGRLLGWLAVVVAGSSLVIGLVTWASGLLLDQAGDALVVVLPLTALVLLAQAVAAFVVAALSKTAFVGLVLRGYTKTTGIDPSRQMEAIPSGQAHRPLRIGLLTGLLVLLAATFTLSYLLLASLRLNDPVAITAHRAGALQAPENTVAAIRKAIEAGADWAEIDVQLTSDGALVVLHDTDLKRVGGVSLAVARATLDDIRAVDVGTPFGPEFRGEKIPTLAEVIAAAGDRIRLNIELKPLGKADVEPLTRGVVEAIRQAGIGDRCSVCSQSYEALQRARELCPGLVTGYIAGASLGDLTGLQVDFLMVRSKNVTRALVQRARLRGMAVHAWTVNTPADLASLVDRGVANIITDDPAAMLARLREIQSLSTVERLLLRVRNQLAD